MQAFHTGFLGAKEFVPYFLCDLFDGITRAWSPIFLEPSQVVFGAGMGFIFTDIFPKWACLLILL